MFSPATVHVLPFDPRFGCDAARLYACKYAHEFDEKAMAQLQQAVDSYRAWREEADILPLWTEQTVWSAKHHYAGSPDLVGAEGDKVVLFDWKTGAGIYPEHGAQVAA